MSDIEQFLRKSKDLIGDSDFEAVKDTLEALLKVNPDLVDSVFYERISRLIDSARISRDTQEQVRHLTAVVDKQQKSMDKLTEQLESIGASFTQLHDQILRNVTRDQQTRQKLNFVLGELEQYLRRHS